MILTLQEAKDLLRVDFDEDDEMIIDLINSVPEYLKNTTGKPWNEEPINPIVKNLAGYLLRKWYSGIDEYDNIINNLIIILTPMAR